MGELSGAFNRMSERLAAAYQKLEQSNSQLAGILQGMNDGVVAVDGQGRIALMTDRAPELLGSYAGRFPPPGRLRHPLSGCAGHAG